jgi:hypothetical protein
MDSTFSESSQHFHNPAPIKTTKKSDGDRLRGRFLCNWKFILLWVFLILAISVLAAISLPGAIARSLPKEESKY